MRYRGNHRRKPLTIVVFVLCGAAALLWAGPADAAAQEKAEAVTVTGIGLSEPLEVHAEDQPELCNALYREVDWLVGQPASASEPDPDTLGPQYTMVVRVGGEDRHRFHLYPLAEGGPRVFRPAEQPGERTADEAWFLGRLSLPETLGSAGVPELAEFARPNGAGGGDPVPEPTEEPERGVFAFLEDWREGMELTVAITLAIVVGLGGAALLIRRRV